jgi:hypothetical protein
MPRRLGSISLLAAALALSGQEARANGAAEPDKEACFAAYEGAQRLRKKRELRRARRELITCGGASCPAALRSDCVTWLAEVDQLQPTLVFSVKSAGRELAAVRVIVDGAPLEGALGGAAVPLDPGEHTLRVEAADHQPFEQKLTVREGEKARAIEIELQRVAEAPPEPGISPAVIALAAVGGVGLASFGVFAIKSHSAKNDLDACKGHCTEDDVDAVRRDQIIADVSLGVGVLALGIAAYLQFGTKSPAREEPASAWSLGVTSLRGGAGATLGRAW